MFKQIFAASTVAALFTSSALGAVIWDEDVDGDFSNVASSPTLVTLLEGESVISGRIGVNNDEGFSDGRDAFTFTVPTGAVVTAVTLTEYSVDNTTTIDVDLDGSDLGIVTMRDELLTGQGPELLGRVVLGSDVALPSELGPGSYVFNYAEFGNAVDYSLSFQASGIPEPTSLVLFGLGGLAVFTRRRARNAS